MAYLSSNFLNVPHYPQTDDGYCLPACVQMVLAYLGLVMLGSLVWDRRWVVLRHWLGAQLLVGLLYLPWAWTAARQLGEHAPPDMRALALRPFLGLIWRFHFSGLSWAAARYPHFVQATLALAILGLVLAFVL